MRNEYPHQHGAQAGHSAISHSLSKRFLGALTPKFSFDVEGTTYSLFREGYPLHLVNYYLESGSSYRDRPDFVVVQGRYLASSRNSICTYTVEVDGKVGRAEFREIDSMSPQVVSWELPPDVIRPPLAAFECSWNKRPKTAAKQLDRYRNLFGMSEGPNSFFVSAREQMEEVVPTITVGPNESRAREITGRFAEALGLALELRSNR